MLSADYTKQPVVLYHEEKQMLEIFEPDLALARICREHEQNVVPAQKLRLPVKKNIVLASLLERLIIKKNTLNQTFIKLAGKACYEWRDSSPRLSASAVQL